MVHAVSLVRRPKRRGSLTFEWILLISLLVIGIIGGLAAVRNALLCELQDLTQCIEAIDCCGGGGDCGECSDDPWDEPDASPPCCNLPFGPDDPW